MQTAWDTIATRALSVAIGYLLGSLSPSYLLSLLLKRIDIRTVGFENAGTRNVKAVLAPAAAVVTFLFMLVHAIRHGVFEYRGGSEQILRRVVARAFALLMVVIDRLWARKFLLYIIGRGAGSPQ